MLDRYTISLNINELTLVLGTEIPIAYEPQYNAAPTKILPLITSRNPTKVSLFHWGLIASWANNKTMSSKLFNLPLDSVLNKNTYKKKIMTHRCIIPMDGFYLWKKTSKKQWIPYYFFYPDKKIFAVAGLWEESEDGIPSFIMITRPANEQISPFQKDMPTIMDLAIARKWLVSDELVELHELLNTKLNENLLFHTVEPKIKNIESNNFSFINNTPPTDQHGNYKLFP